MTTVALAHDYLTQRGGAERVVVAMARAFPEAAIHTSLYLPEATFPELARSDVHTMPIDRIGALRRQHRLALPLLAPSFSATRVEADIVVCSSSGWAHGVHTDGRKLVYCHAPARWLYQPERYLAEAGRGTRAGLRVLAPALRRWDRAAAGSAHRYLANSERTRRMVGDIYGIDATVVHPPHGMDPDGRQQAVAGLEHGYFLCVSRLLPYKNVDAVTAAFASRPADMLVVVGRGPDAERVRAQAPANVRFVDVASDDELRWLYAHARAVVGASFEDFGLTPLEAAAFGTPSIVLRFGGYLETVVEDETGVFFDEPHPRAIAAAVERLARAGLSAAAIRRQADRFSEEPFLAALRRSVVETLAAG